MRFGVFVGFVQISTPFLVTCLYGSRDFIYGLFVGKFYVICLLNDSVAYVWMFCMVFLGRCGVRFSVDVRVGVFWCELRVFRCEILEFGVKSGWDVRMRLSRCDI